MLAALSLCLCSTGCLIFEDVDRSPAYNQQIWKQELAEDQVRLGGIDARPDFWQTISTSIEPIRVVAMQFVANERLGDQARLLQSPNPDARRNAVYRLSSGWTFARQDPYTQRYAFMAIGNPASTQVKPDPSPNVRAAALRALNLSRDGSRTPVYIASLEDNSPRVRLEAAKALANIPDAGAIKPLIKLLKDRNEDQDVRIAAADALRCYRDSMVARALIEALGYRNFGIVHEAHQSLRFIAGEDLGYDANAWLEWVLRADLS